MKVRVAERRPAAGGVRVPLRYCQSMGFTSRSPGRYRPTQSVRLPGPPDTETVSAPPGMFALGKAESIACGALAVNVLLVASRVKVSFTKKRNSKVPGAVGRVKLSVAAVSRMDGGVRVPLRYCQSVGSVSAAPMR